VVFIIPGVAKSILLAMSKEDDNAIETAMLSEAIGIKPRNEDEDGGGGSLVWLGRTLPPLSSINQRPQNASFIFSMLPDPNRPAANHVTSQLPCEYDVFWVQSLARVSVRDLAIGLRAF
jgi:hypothetical protein